MSKWANSQPCNIWTADWKNTDKFTFGYGNPFSIRISALFGCLFNSDSCSIRMTAAKKHCLQSSKPFMPRESNEPQNIARICETIVNSKDQQESNPGWPKHQNEVDTVNGIYHQTNIKQNSIKSCTIVWCNTVGTAGYVHYTTLQ